MGERGGGGGGLEYNPGFMWGLDQYDLSVCLGGVSGYGSCPLEGFDYITGLLCLRQFEQA